MSGSISVNYFWDTILEVVAKPHLRLNGKDIVARSINTATGQYRKYR